MITNPILKGFNPDPCICRKGEDFYLAVSSFEWLPGIPIYHSKDLKNWELLTHILDDEIVDLKKLPSAKGIWAPDLTYCEEEDKFYVVYGVMNNMNARYFDIDNYLITADSIEGPWSKPVYLHSAGFDASIFHDDNGKKYILSLDWETRDQYEKPGAINIVEYDGKNKCILGNPKRFWNGATDRGCIEAPRMTKYHGYYYIMCAEGGTGYNHCVSMGRSKNINGVFEKDPKGAIVTSQPVESNERADYDHLKPKYYNPDSPLQKSGHGSYVNLSDGEVYLVHLTARPFVTEDENIRSKYRCTLGRETAIQKMEWTKDGWLRIRGQEALTSLNKVSLLCRKLTSVNASFTTKMEFKPKNFQQSAGVVIYYDNMNYTYLRKCYSESLGGAALSLQQMENGQRKQWLDERVLLEREDALYLKIEICGRDCQFLWSIDNKSWKKIGPVIDTSLYSDEYCKYGEFTGTMVGVCCLDRMSHKEYADFDFIEYKELD